MVRNPAEFPSSVQSRDGQESCSQKTKLSSNFSSIEVDDLSEKELSFSLTPQEINVGEDVGGFKILEKLLTTSIWEEYRAFQFSRDREVSLKVLSPKQSQNPQLIERFKEEQRLSCSITHPGLLPGYGSGFDGNFYYIASKLLLAPRLDEFILEAQGHRGELFFREAASLFAYLCHSIASLHAQGIYHRDIRPANMYLMPGEKIVLGNFGSALDKNLDNSRFFPENAPFEIKIYRAPECLEDEEQTLSPTSDVYSIAICFYELLTGVQPFRELSEEEIHHHKLHRKVPCPRNYLPNAPLALEGILRQALTRDPRFRIQNATELAREFERFAETKRPNSRQHPSTGGYEDPKGEDDEIDSDPNPDFILI